MNVFEPPARAERLGAVCGEIYGSRRPMNRMTGLIVITETLNDRKRLYLDLPAVVIPVITIEDNSYSLSGFAFSDILTGMYKLAMQTR
jgi:hypothetical protein